MTLGGPSPFVSFLTHPVKAARTAEALSLLGLIALQHGENDRADEIVSVVSDLVEATPGVAHVVSDEWAFSVMITAVLLAARGKLPVARELLREAAVWTLDKIEFGDGIAQQDDDMATVTARLLGPPYPKLRIGADRSAYVFSVILDLAHLLGLSDLFDDLLNDLDAVGGFARLVYDDGEARPQLIARVEYSSSKPAKHHHIPSNSTPPGAEREWFDCVAIWATVRDRQVPAVISEVLDLGGR